MLALQILKIRNDVKRIRVQVEGLHRALRAHNAFLDHLTVESKRLPYPQDYRQKYTDWLMANGYRELK